MRTKTTLQADKILRAASQLFAGHRFHEARMEDIAALAEVGKGTLYRYFKDKEELYLALLHRAAEGLLQRLQQAIQRFESPRAQLVEVVEALLAYFDENPHLFDLIQHAEALQRSNTEFPWQAVRNQTLSLVRGILQAGQKLGEFHIPDQELATLMLLGGLRSVVRFGPHLSRCGLALLIVNCLLNGFQGDCSASNQPLEILPEKTSQPRILSSVSTKVIDGTTSPLHNA